MMTRRGSRPSIALETATRVLETILDARSLSGISSSRIAGGMSGLTCVIRRSSVRRNIRGDYTRHPDSRWTAAAGGWRPDPQPEQWFHADLAFSRRECQRFSGHLRLMRWRIRMTGRLCVVVAFIGMLALPAPLRATCRTMEAGAERIARRAERTAQRAERWAEHA